MLNRCGREIGRSPTTGRYSETEETPKKFPSMGGEREKEKVLSGVREQIKKETGSPWLFWRAARGLRETERARSLICTYSFLI